MSACTRILGLEGTPEGVEDQGRLTRVAAVWPFSLLETLTLIIHIYVTKITHKTLSCFWFGFQFPIGIDSERFIRALEATDVINHMKELKERFAGRKVHRISSEARSQLKYYIQVFILSPSLTGDVRC